MRDQAARRLRTPPRRLIPWITRVTVWIYRVTKGRLGGSQRGMDHVLLTTIGRKSGHSHTVCLPISYLPEGVPVIVASYAGSDRHPAWFHNLRDRQANPTVTVMDRSDEYRARAGVLTGADRTHVWERLLDDRPWYADYQAVTSREIPLVRLERLSD